MNRIARFNREKEFSWGLKALFTELDVSEEALIDGFENFLKQYRDIEIIKTSAAEADLIPRNFLTDDHMSLSFDLCFEDECICQIYKTWNDPGFRIVRDVAVGQESPLFRLTFIKIEVLCNTNFIGYETRQDVTGRSVLGLEIGIFEGGLNGKVLRTAVNVLEHVAGKVERIIEDRKV